MSIFQQNSLPNYPHNIGANYLDQEILESLIDLMDGDAEMIFDLVDTLLEDTPRLISALTIAMQQRDVALVHRHAHSLKSSNAQLGANSFAAICQELESQAKIGNLEHAEGLISQIRQEFGRVKQALDDWKTRF